MKTIYSILLLLVCSSFAGTIDYPVAGLYAYKQKISSGANSTFDKKNKPVNKEYVYLAVKQNRTIHIYHVWVNGTSVNFKTEEVKSPVAIEAGVSLTGKETTQVLVPETTHTVLQVLIDNATIAEGKALPKRYKKYALLIQYTEGSSVFFLGSQNWTTIAPKANQ